MNIEEEISKIKWDDIKKYGVKSIDCVRESGYDTLFVFDLYDRYINTKKHKSEVIDLLTKIKSDKRNNTINDILN